MKKKTNADLIKQPKTGRKLTPKMLLFCKLYVCNGWNASKAALDAGYSEKASKEIACRLLTNANIQDRIKYVREHTEETIGLNKEMIMREHMKLAFSSIAHLHNTWIERKEFETLTPEQKECISEIDTKTVHKVETEYNKSGDPVKVPYDVEYVKIKLYDKQKSLDSLSKLMGYDAPARFDVNNTGTPAIVQLIRVDQPNVGIYGSEQESKESEGL